MTTPHIGTADALARAFNSLPDEEKYLFIKWFRQAAIPPTADELVRLFNAAPQPEKEAFVLRIWHQHLLPAVPEEHIHAEINRVVVPQVEEIRRRDKEARDASPRNQDRDAEIVRLKDEVLPNGVQRSFGEVHHLIVQRWPKAERGMPLTVSAVKAAYKRAKPSPKGRT